MHAIYQHFSELIEQAVIQLCPNLFLNFPAAAELQVYTVSFQFWASSNKSIKVLYPIPKIDWVDLEHPV